MKKILILGGTQMLGRDLVEKIQDNEIYDITLANRGITNPSIFPNIKHITIDRNFKESCLKLSDNILYDYVLDFSCYNLSQFVNSNSLINCYNYIYISTVSVFDVSSNQNYVSNNTPNAMYLNYCIGKRDVETYILQTDFPYNIFIIRPCAIYGKNDYTQRFEEKNGNYYWKGTEIQADYKTNCVNVSVVTQKLTEILENKIGLETKNIITIGKIPQ